MSETVDLVIIGGGCAGLSLARELAARQVPISTVIIEPRQAYSADRSWCFWRRDDEPRFAAETTGWRSWSLSNADRTVAHHGARWTYAMVASDAFYRDALDAIAGTSWIDLRLNTSVREVDEGDMVVAVQTDAGRIHARRVVDTRPPAPEMLRRARLAQVFSGAEVETDTDRFDASTAVVMGNLRTSKDGIVFDYVLPISPRRALIEHTYFGTAPPDERRLDAARDRLVAQCAGAAVRVMRREWGWLPMGLPVQRSASKRVIPAGTAAGALRASSGYGFRRIQDWARACADQLAGGGAPRAQPRDPAFRRYMDAVFLKVLAKHPDAAPEIFVAMARALGADAFARFMSDQAVPSDWARIVWALPKGIFAASALAELTSLPRDQRRLA